MGPRLETMQQQILGLVTPAIAILFAMTFVMLWVRNRKASHILAFAIGYVALAVGFAVFHYSPDPNGAVATLVMHLVYCLSVSAICWGTGSRAGVRIRLRTIVTITLVSSAVIYMVTFSDNHNPRLYAANATYGLLFALTAQILSRSARNDTIDRIIVLLLALISAQFFVRVPIQLALQGPMLASEYRESVYYSMVIVSVAIVSLMLAMTLVTACVADQITAVRKEADTDDLTGLMTRRSFEEAAIEMLSSAGNTDTPVSLVVADIDHFKQVNDIWGHQAGDNAIAAFGRLAVGLTRDCDLVGRIGGEEYCFLIWNCDSASSVRLADRVRSRFATLAIDGVSPDMRITASFGVATWRTGEGYGRLFARADAALYRAKEQGRDRVVGEQVTLAPDIVEPRDLAPTAAVG